MPRFTNPCVGYVFTGLFLFRAKTSKDLIVAATSKEHIEGEVLLFPWYTYRRVENAISRLQKQLVGIPPVNLNVVSYTPELANEMAKDSLAKARLTRDHILHMLTAGKNVNSAQLQVAETEADAVVDRMIKANQKASQAVA